MPTKSKVWPYALLIVIAKHNRIGNCILLNGRGNFSSSDVSSGILGMNTCVFLKSPLDIVALITCDLKSLHIKRVPLHNPSQGFRFLSNIIGQFF